MADPTPAANQNSSKLGQLCLTSCVIFTGLTVIGYLLTTQYGVVEHLVIAVSAAAFSVFGGPILRAKVVNGQEVSNG